MTLLFIYSCNNRKIESDNLVIFAKVYGYIKYFHPSDESTKIDWEKLSAFGSKEIIRCRSKQQLVSTLNELFNPIAPSVKFVISQFPPIYDLSPVKPENESNYRLTYWQHKGVSIGMRTFSPYQTYNSVRVNRHKSPEEVELFDYKPTFDNIFTKELETGLYCQLPIFLYCNDKTTYPKADSLSFVKLNNNLRDFDYNKNKLFFRLGNVINVYNVFQHFFPYFDVVNINWGNELKIALLRSFTDKSADDHLVTLQRFTAPLKDGHINVSLKSKSYFAPPVTWEWIENKLIITRVFEEISGIQVGDVVSKINGINSDEYFKNIYPLISAGTAGWLNYKANFLSLVGEYDSKITLTINGKTINLVRKRNDLMRMNLAKEPIYKKLDDNIWYLNMSKIPIDTINKIMPELGKSKSIICDARGYPAGNHEFITHLMTIDDTVSGWMQIPHIVFPDHEKIVGFEKHNWISVMRTKKPYLGDRKIIYIIDGSAISYAESCLGYIEGYKLATIIGQPSAGTNGNINSFDLPGGYSMTWTGMKVVKHSGSQHHGIGIIPDILVTKTIQGIKEGHDQFLEKAIELAEKQ